jgi:hypothetical protein
MAALPGAKYAGTKPGYISKFTRLRKLRVATPPHANAAPIAIIQ